MNINTVRLHGQRLGLGLLAAWVLCAWVGAAGAQTPSTLLYSIPAPAGKQSGAKAGRQIATNGVRTVVGAPGDDTSASNAGVARVYDAVTGALLHVLPNPNPANGDAFGDEVAISGNRVVVAASDDDLGAGDAGTVYVFDLTSPTPTVPVLTLANPAPQSGANFGICVAISGNLLVAGAFDHDLAVTNCGIAYVYDLSSGTPTVPVQTLTKPVPVAEDKFGGAVAISGTRVVVGCEADDTGASNTGSAYVFDMSSPTPTVPVQTLYNPTPEADDRFGFRVAISGSYAVVAADLDNTGAHYAGSVYVYDLGSGTADVPMATLNNPGPAAVDQFGYGLAIAGNRIVVGVVQDDTGATNAGCAYVYDLSGSSVTLAFTLLNPAPAYGDFFGAGVAVSGATVVVGAEMDDGAAVDAGTTYAYNLAGGTPTVPVFAMSDPGISVGDQFGSGTALSGTRLAVGAPWEDTDAGNSGMVYVYDLMGATPAVPMLTIHNPTPGADDLFGYAVSLSGPLLAVGAYQDSDNGTRAGAVYVYDLSSATPTVPLHYFYEWDIAENFGYSVDISGNYLVVGSNFNNTNAQASGCAYVYDLKDDFPTWPVVTLYNPGPAANDRFGRSVSISGTRVVVGAYLDDTGAADSGCAYVYDISSGTADVPTHTLLNPTPASSDSFGRYVSIDGSRVAVSGGLDNTGANDAGSVYVYDLTSVTPASPAFTINNPEPAAGDNFGNTIEISGTRVLVGAYFDDFGAANSGSAYLYDLTSATPLSPVVTFRNPTPAQDDQFGNYLSLDGDMLAVPAPLDDTVAVNKGSVYVYGLPPEIVVEYPAGTSLTDGSGDAVSFGDFQFGVSSPARLFTVRNIGPNSLHGLGVTMGGANAAGITLDVSALGSFIAPGGSATFAVTLAPSSAGAATATLQISSTDLDENPFDIHLSGQSYSATFDTDGDGMKDWQEFQLSALGFNWQVANAALVNTYFATASQNGLYTASQVQDLNVGIPLLQRNPATGAFTLRVGVEKSTNLGAWTPLPMTAPQTLINSEGKLEFQFMAPGTTGFFRVRAE